MTITVSCPSCSTTFPVDADKIPEGGVRAQCSACPEIFAVEKPEEIAAESTFADTEASVAEAPVVEAPVVEAPVVEAPVVEAPVVEAPVVEAPVVEAPVVEAPVADPSASVEAPVVELDEVEVPDEVKSSFGADAEVVADIATETADEFGEREISFGSITTEADEADPVEAGPAPTDDFGAIELDAPVGEVAEAPAEAAPSAAPIQFGKRTPEDKARSLARSLVSDLIAYNPDKHTEALASGTLVQVFSEEIQKSWKEYKDQVDPDVITQGTFFNDALNELLANGESVFDVEG